MTWIIASKMDTHRFQEEFLVSVGDVGANKAGTRKRLYIYDRSLWSHLIVSEMNVTRCLSFKYIYVYILNGELVNS